MLLSGLAPFPVPLAGREQVGVHLGGGREADSQSSTNTDCSYHGSKAVALSEHPNPTTKIGSKMGGEFTLVPLVLTHRLFSEPATIGAHRAPKTESPGRLAVAIRAIPKGSSL